MKYSYEFKFPAISYTLPKYLCFPNLEIICNVPLICTFVFKLINTFIISEHEHMAAAARPTRRMRRKGPGI